MTTENHSSRLLAFGVTVSLGLAACAVPTAETSAIDERTASTGEALSAGAPVTFRSVLPGGRCLEALGQNPANSTRVDIYDCWGGANQSWTMYSDGTIRGLGGKCLDVQNTSASPPNGTPVGIYDCWGGANQNWAYTEAGEIRITGSSKCLEAPNELGANLSLLELSDCNGAPNQHWITTSEFTWDQTIGHATVMWPVSQGLCLLTGVSGNFEGLGEAVEVDNWGGTWVLTGTSGETGVAARAKCVSWTDLGGYGYGTNYWTSYSKPSHTGYFTAPPVEMWNNVNFCALSRMTGNIATNASVDTWFDGANWWVKATGYYGQVDVDATAMCVGSGSAALMRNTTVAALNSEKNP